MNLLLKNSLVSSLLLFIVAANLACQPSSSGSKPSGNNSTQKNNDKPDSELPNSGDGSKTPISCEDAWAKKVKENPVGLLIQRGTKQYIINNNQKNLVSESKSTEKVTFNNELKIVILHILDFVFPMSHRSENETEDLKSSFLELCQNAPSVGSEDPTPTPGYEFVQKGTETITVPAGTFTCTHIQMNPKGENTGNIQNLTIDSWISQEHQGLLVKSIQKGVNRTSRNTVSETQIETELLQFKF